MKTAIIASVLALNTAAIIGGAAYFAGQKTAEGPKVQEAPQVVVQNEVNPQITVTHQETYTEQTMLQYNEAPRFEYTPQQSAPNSCWFQMVRDGEGVAANCTVTSRINNNGHLVWDVVEHGSGIKRTVVLWGPSTGYKAEVIVNGVVHTGNWSLDNSGDAEVSLQSGTFWFTGPTSTNY